MPSFSQNSGSSTSSSGPSQQLIGMYGNEYNTALGLNQSNYNNLLAGYQSSVGNAGQQFNSIANGYGQLSNQVLGGIAGVGRSQAQAIQDQYLMAQGQQGQSLINSGLGNSTVMGSMQRGLTLDSQKAQIALANQIAQLTAGYQAQLGSAGLQARAQGAATQAQLGGQYMGALASYRTPYPSWPPNAGQSQSTQKGQSVNSGGMGGGMPGLGQDNGLWAGGQPSNSGVPPYQTNPYAGPSAPTSGGQQQDASEFLANQETNNAANYGSGGPDNALNSGAYGDPAAAGGYGSLDAPG